MSAPLCKDCRYFTVWTNRCQRPVAVRSTLVHGDEWVMLDANAYRERSRERTLFGRECCGPSARFFEQKLPPPKMRPI
jgi:hypothetical protein